MLSPDQKKFTDLSPWEQLPLHFAEIHRRITEAPSIPEKLKISLLYLVIIGMLPLSLVSSLGDSLDKKKE